MKKNTEKNKKATAETLATTVDNCDNVLVFIQAFTVKSPRVIASPLSLRVEKCARIWFRWWSNKNLPMSEKTAPQDHMGITGVLSDVATRLQNSEALCPIVSAQRKVEKETKTWDHIPPMAQRVIMEASATSGTSIPTSPPSILHRLLNA